MGIAKRRRSLANLRIVTAAPVIRPCRHVTNDLAAHADQTARPALAQPVLLAGMSDGSPLRAGRYQSFDAILQHDVVEHRLGQGLFCRAFSCSGVRSRRASAHLQPVGLRRPFVERGLADPTTAANIRRRPPHLLLVPTAMICSSLNLLRLIMIRETPHSREHVTIERLSAARPGHVEQACGITGAAPAATEEEHVNMSPGRYMDSTSAPIGHIGALKEERPDDNEVQAACCQDCYRQRNDPNGS